MKRYDRTSLRNCTWFLSLLFVGLGLLTLIRDVKANSFEEDFEEYIQKQEQSFYNCTTQACYSKLSAPVIRLTHSGAMNYWNTSALWIPLHPQYSKIWKDDLCTYLTIKNEAGYLLFVPLKFADGSVQENFICTRIDQKHRFTTYDVRIAAKDDGQNRFINIQTNSKLGAGFVVFYFIVVLCLFLLLLVLSKKLVSLFGKGLGTVFVILLLTCVRLVVSLPFITGAFQDHQIFQHHLHTHILSPSLGELFLNMLLFFIITIFLLRTYDSSPVKVVQRLKRWQLLFVGYGLILISILSLVYVVKQVVIRSPISFQFDKIYVLDWNTHVFILSILLFISSLFLLSYLLIKILRGTGADIGERIMSFFIATLVTYPIFLNLDLGLSAFAFYILLFSMLVLMDLFVDTKQKSISWLVLWLVTISSGTTALLYSYNSSSTIEKGYILAKELAIAYQEGKISPFQDGQEVDQYHWSISEANDVKASWGNPDPSGHSQYPRIGYYSSYRNHQSHSIVYRPHPGVLIYLTKYQNAFIQFISLFSFLFTSMTIVFILMFIIHSLIKFLPDSWNLKFGIDRSIRSRIQYVIFGMLILSFTTAFAVTSFYLRDLQHANATRPLSELQNELDLVISNIDLLKDSQADRSALQSWFTNNNRFALYTSSGHLLSGRSDHPNRSPFELISATRTASKSYLLPSEYGKKRLFNTLPYSENKYIISVSEQIKPEEENYFINNLLGTLLNLFIFLFVIASSIALTFSDTITKPLLKLREKLSSIKIGHNNERLEWHTNDEFGLLINDYNRMLGKIEESVNILAMTEREVAWREMAKQVAHEIKNPLTPMKLNLQHLQLAIKREPARATELVDRMSKTLLEQIDNLSHIASEFSNFAKMPSAENKKVVLNDVASSVHDLFRKREDMDINLYVPIDEIYVFGDHHYMTRVLINLLKNAIQSIPTKRRGQIDITVYKDEVNAMIKVNDNGSGIPKEIQGKVFQPNFTSKNSGTGLGLAICANIIESFNGKIYFETEENIGTTFFIEIPLMRMEDNFKEENRVVL